jgi:hypothetical protein
MGLLWMSCRWRRGHLPAAEHLYWGVQPFLGSVRNRSDPRRKPLIFVGIDWSEQHHEVEVQAESGLGPRSRPHLGLQPLSLFSQFERHPFVASQTPSAPTTSSVNPG